MFLPVFAIPIETAALNLATALVCGAIIGSERQVRQRMAGLRTNALVALGAAAFVTFSGLYPNEISQTRVAAQIVSGIGFLGAGIIFRDGFNIHGLNTAATLWCSAGVGMLAGAGAWHLALLLTGFVVFINLGMRPLVKFIKRRTRAGASVGQQIRLSISCRTAQDAEVRALLLRTLAIGGLHLAEIAITPSRHGAEIDIDASVTALGMTHAAIEQAMSRLQAEPGLARVAWTLVEES